MMRKTPAGNALFYGDNLSVLRESIEDESIDLIYLDPPFNSNASYNVLFKSPTGDQSSAQIEAFDDSWHWTDSAEAAFQGVLTSGNSNASEMLRAMRQFLGENDMMAYLAMMAVRLLELHRVLKPTGSLYLHCDPTASHYLKILLDAVFGARNCRSEIIWKRTSSHNSARRWGPIHDTILFVSKSDSFVWNKVFSNYDADYVARYYRHKDRYGRLYRLSDLTGSGTRNGESGQEWGGFHPNANGRHWAIPTSVKEAVENPPQKRTPHEWLEIFDQNGLIEFTGDVRWPHVKRYLDQMEGMSAQDIIDDVGPLSKRHQERLGYPTQKPVALLERIINASSNEGDVVLDPFCGCGTTVHAAQKLGRRWIGIDVTHLAVSLIERRLRDAFAGISFEVHGVPRDIDGARALAAADKHEFEKWAISLVPNAQPWKGGKKGADRGIDGVLYAGKTSERCFISVKGGKNIGVAMIRDLVGVPDREKAPMGLFVTLEEPTKPMIAEAAAAGHWEIEGFAPVPRVQIVTIEDLLTSVAPPIRLPLARHDTFKKAKPEVRENGQKSLDF